MGGYDFGAQLLRVGFTEDQDHSVSITCTPLWLQRPQSDMRFDCDQRFAVTYAWHSEPYQYTEGRAIITLYEIETGKKSTLSLVSYLVFGSFGEMMGHLKFSRRPSSTPISSRRVMKLTDFAETISGPSFYPWRPPLSHLKVSRASTRNFRRKTIVTSDKSRK